METFFALQMEVEELRKNDQDADALRAEIEILNAKLADNYGFKFFCLKKITSTAWISIVMTI